MPMIAGILDEEGKVLQARFRLPHGRDVDEGCDPADHPAFRVALGDARAPHALLPGRGERLNTSYSTRSPPSRG
jgi:hypothetical protein